MTRAYWTLLGAAGLLLFGAMAESAAAQTPGPAALKIGLLMDFSGDSEVSRSARRSTTASTPTSSSVTPPSGRASCDPSAESTLAACTVPGLRRRPRVPRPWPGRRLTSPSTVRCRCSPTSRRPTTRDGRSGACGPGRRPVDGAAIRDRLRAVGGPPGTVVGAGPQGVAEALRILGRGGEIDYEGASGSLDWDENGDLRRGHIGIWRFTEDDHHPGKSAMSGSGGNRETAHAGGGRRRGGFVTTRPDTSPDAMAAAIPSWSRSTWRRDHLWAEVLLRSNLSSWSTRVSHEPRGVIHCRRPLELAAKSKRQHGP